MNKLFTLLSLLTIGIFNAQTTFEKGYFTDNSGNKTQCLLKNIDWKNNPTIFQYKVNENGETLTGSIEEIQNFGIENKLRFERYNVQIDRSSSDFDVMSKERNPIFVEETLFLRVLFEGKANLYAYFDGNLKRFFYATKATKPKQLVYKKFKSSDYKVSTNNLYKQQLLNILSNDCITEKELKALDYEKLDLIKIFKTYNTCNDETLNFEQVETKRKLFHLKVTPGIKRSSLESIHESLSTRTFNYDNETTYRLGLEFEFVFPFNNNKWAFFVEPTYQSYSSEKRRDSPLLDIERLYTVDYKTVDVTTGFRHYFFVNKESKIFIDAMVAMVIDLDSNITIKRLDLNTAVDSVIEIDSNTNFALGVGFKHKKYSVELRQSFNRDILKKQVNWNTNYSNTSLIFGYTLF